MKIYVAILFSWLLIFGEALAIKPLGILGKGRLNQLSFLPDGTMLRVLRTHIEIVEPDSDRVLANFAGKSDFIRRVAFNQDGRRAIVARKDIVELWDIAAQKELRQLKFRGHLDRSNPIVFNKAGSLLAISNGKDQIDLWKWDTGELMGRLEDGRRRIQNCYSRTGTNWRSTSCTYPASHDFSMALSPDDRLLVVGSHRPDAEIWNLETRRLVGHLEGHRDWVTDVAYSPNGRWIATTEPESTTVYLWNAETRELVRTWQNGGQGETIELFFSRDSRRLYVVTRATSSLNTSNNRMHVWDIETHTMVNEFHAELTRLERVSVSPDESRAILQYRDQIAELWDMKQDRHLRLTADYTGFAQSRISPDGESLVQVYYTLIKIWDVPSRSLRQLVFAVPQRYRGAVAISPDSRRFTVALPSSGTEVRDIDTGELLVRLPEIEDWSAFAFNQRGNRIAASHKLGDPMVVFDVNRPHRQQLLEIGETSGRPVMPRIAFGRDDRYLVAVDS
ncbi:MAG: WD40 repeat domain-containing protein, partial [Candidatus Poribacteria bacterium]|nr:WD40 repeat domain-containing protein [Candidatus Poribacteria bacterium]